MDVFSVHGLIFWFSRRTNKEKKSKHFTLKNVFLNCANGFCLYVSLHFLLNLHLANPFG